MRLALSGVHTLCQTVADSQPFIPANKYEFGTEAIEFMADTGQSVNVNTIYSRVAAQIESPAMARKITGMLLECDAQEKAEMLADEARMHEWVSLAMEELQRAGLLDTAHAQPQFCLLIL